ncbi:5'-nucleotidase [Vibrio mediterranei]|uniref:5'-nucleotidase n=1 Tax=Vibrio mediterranei TaxID=689 RepID=UPI0040688009
MDNDLGTLIIAISSSALFDTTECELVYLEYGSQEYEEYRERTKDTPLEKGPAFGLIKKLLRLNELSEKPLIEVVILSRNSAETGKRVFSSVEHYGLDICRGVFTDGLNPRRFARGFGASLFLSKSDSDVRKSVNEGIPAGLVIGGTGGSDEDSPLLLAVDFDGVIASDESERVYKTEGLESFTQNEIDNKTIPLTAGPMANLLQKLSAIRKTDLLNSRGNKHKRALRIALVTARSAPAHERVLTTLKDLEIECDIHAFMGGKEKNQVLNEMKPDVFIDDQKLHLNDTNSAQTLVHIPFGVANNTFSKT